MRVRVLAIAAVWSAATLVAESRLTSLHDDQDPDAGGKTATVIARRDPAECDPSYPTVCIPSPPPDLNCNEILFANFRVVGDDPHGFDADHDGVGCES